MFEIRVTKLDNQESNVKGLVSMVVDGKFAFSSMRVIESEKRREDFCCNAIIPDKGRKVCGSV